MAFAIITSGVFAVYVSLQLKRVKGIPQKISDDLRKRYEDIRKEIEDFRD